MFNQKLKRTLGAIIYNFTVFVSVVFMVFLIAGIFADVCVAIASRLGPN